MRLLFVFMILIGSTACTEAPTENTDIQQQQSINELVNADKFQELIEEGAGQLLDVRTPGEYASGHIEDAMNIDFLGDDFMAQLDQLDKSKPVLIYCASAGRSTRAAKLMIDNGFTEIYNLAGGYNAWPY